MNGDQLPTNQLLNINCGMCTCVLCLYTLVCACLCVNCVLEKRYPHLLVWNNNCVISTTKFISLVTNEESSISVQAEGAKPSGIYFYLHTHTQTS